MDPAADEVHCLWAEALIVLSLVLQRASSDHLRGVLSQYPRMIGLARRMVA